MCRGAAGCCASAGLAIWNGPRHATSAARAKRRGSLITRSSGWCTPGAVAGCYAQALQRSSDARRDEPDDQDYPTWGEETREAYNDQNAPIPNMRLGPISNHRSRLTEEQKLSCVKCKVEFIILQMIKINDMQLCIWCAGHPEKMSTRALTVNTRPPLSKRRVVYKNL
jgi:hypothetical protein